MSDKSRKKAKDEPVLHFHEGLLNFIVQINQKTKIIFSDYSKTKSVHQISGFFFISGIIYVLFAIYISRGILDSTPELNDAVSLLINN